MDSLTHTLTGAVIGKAIEDEEVKPWGTVAGLVAGFFPDMDFALGLINRQFYLQYHRDFTHSFLLLPFYALLLSWLFTKITRRPHLWSYYKICLLVLVSHVLLDLFTSYGTMVFAPFSDHRYAWDLTFIVDLIFSGILFIPWIISLFWRKKAAWLCRGSLMLLTAYILFCAVQHHRAINVTKQFAGSLNEEVVQIASLPQPLSPFRWSNYVETRENVYQGFVDFLAKGSPSPKNPRTEAGFDGSGFFGRFRRWKLMEGLYHPASSVRYSAYQKNDGSALVKRAMATEGAKFYYWFARFPVAKLVNSNNGTHRVEFTDVRFFIPGIRLPFSYYVELDDAGRVLSEGFVRNGKRG